MSAPDLEVIKDIPGYKVILKAILKSQIQQLVEQLASHTDEESVILTASVSDGTLCHLGSDSGKNFLEDHEDIKSQFLGFCLKRHHKKKQLEKEKAEAAAAARNMPTTPTRYGGPGPRPGYGRSPRFSSPPRQQGIHPVALTRASPGAHGIRSPGARHEPYPQIRPPRRGSLNFEQGRSPVPNLVRGPGPSPGAMRLPLGTKLDGPVIKIEADDPEESESNQSVNDSNNQNVSVAGAPCETSSSQPSSPSQVPSRPSSTSQMKTEQSDKDDDANSESSSSTIPNEASDLKFSDTAPPEGLSLDSDLSNLISRENNSGAQSSNIQQSPHTPTSAPPTPGSSSELNPEINVKVEAITDLEMELEITGVEPGRMPIMGSGSQDNWDVPGGMGYDPSGATGSQADMQGSEQGYKMLEPDSDQKSNTQVQDQANVKEEIDDAEKHDDEPIDLSLPDVTADTKVPNDLFGCTICEKSYRTKATLKRHLKKHSKDFQFECTYCHQYFATMDAFDAHKLARHSAKFLCIKCGQSFNKQSHLTHHSAKHDPDNYPGILFKCAFESCGKSFLSKTVYEDHVNVHNAVKPFECCKCHHKFHGRYRKTQHERVCMGIEKITCVECGLEYTDKSSLKRHRDNKHRHLVHRCVCGKSFLYQASLYKHKKKKNHYNIRS